MEFHILTFIKQNAVFFYLFKNLIHITLTFESKFAFWKWKICFRLKINKKQN